MGENRQVWSGKKDKVGGNGQGQKQLDESALISALQTLDNQLLMTREKNKGHSLIDVFINTFNFPGRVLYHYDWSLLIPYRAVKEMFQVLRTILWFLLSPQNCELMRR